VLHAAAQGAMAGRAASEQAVVQSHGMRSAGAGAGFMAAQQDIQQRQQFGARQQQNFDISQQRQAATQMQRERIQSYPADRTAAQGRMQAQTQRQLALTDATIARMKQVPSDKLLHSYVNADGKQTIVFQAGDGSTYEKSFGQVQQRAEPHPRAPQHLVMGDSTYLINPDDPSKVTRIGPAPAHQGYDANGQRRTPQSTYVKIEAAKGRSLANIERNSSLTEDQKLAMKQQVQDTYENQILAAGGDPEHYDYQQQGGQAAPAVNAKDPLGIR
jgi:hypothetical protein